VSEANALDLEGLRQWIGRSEVVQDTITPRLEASFRATLDRPPEQPAIGDPATLGVHWCLAPPIVPMQALGDDGHPRRGGFLPPVPLPRRMWAGGELVFEATLQVGDVVTRTSRIEDVVIKEGRSGTMCFVTVRHSWTTQRGPALQERQDIVYRPAEAARPAAPVDVVSSPQVSYKRVWPCDPVLLFRYSALTFNGHRIHYDYPYVTDVEGYGGLIVHGPLQATLLMGLATEAWGRAPSRFAFRGVAPLVAAGSLVAKAGPNGGALRLWIEDAGGRTTMTADAS
jgi:3-methylfumaryl-CoA hydratase